MANAKRCDRCHEYYIQEFPQSPVVSGCKLVYVSNIAYEGYTRATVDLCPSCAKQLMTFLREKSEP